MILGACQFVVKNSLQRQLKTICRLDALEATDALAKLKRQLEHDTTQGVVVWCC